MREFYQGCHVTYCLLDWEGPGYYQGWLPDQAGDITYKREGNEDSGAEYFADLESTGANKNDMDGDLYIIKRNVNRYDISVKKAETHKAAGLFQLWNDYQLWGLFHKLEDVKKEAECKCETPTFCSCGSLVIQQYDPNIDKTRRWNLGAWDFEWEELQPFENLLKAVSEA